MSGRSVAVPEPTPPSDAGAGELFDVFAREWHDFYDDPAAADRAVEFLVRQRLAVDTVTRLLEPGERILEIGCGTGSTAVLLARRGFRVTALDVSAEMVAAARRSASAAGVELDVHQGDEHSVPGDRFGGVVALGVTEYLDDLPDFLAGVRDRLRVGGVVAISFTNRSSPFRWIELPLKRIVAGVVYLFRRDKRWWQVAFATGRSHRPFEVRDEMERVGLAPVRFTYLGYGVRFGSRWFPPTGGAIVRAENTPGAAAGRMFVAVTGEPVRDGVSPADPSALPRLARLHTEAFAGSMGVSLGGRYRRRFLREFVVEPDRCAFMAREDGEIVGYVLGAPVDRRSFSPQLGAAAALALVRHPSLLRRPEIRAEVVRRLRRPGPPGSEVPSLPEPIFSLVGIGVAETARGSGIADALIEEFERFAADRGYRAVRLSVYRDNDRARAVYLRHGWRPFDHPSNPDVLYYGKELSAAPA